MQNDTGRSAYCGICRHNMPGAVSRGSGISTDISPFRGICRVCHAERGRFSADYSKLGEKEFYAALKQYNSLQELDGLANRRRHLNALDLPRWSAVQREMILRRKWELEHDRG